MKALPLTMSSGSAGYASSLIWPYAAVNSSTDYRTTNKNYHNNVTIINFIINRLGQPIKLYKFYNEEIELNQQGCLIGF